MSFTEAYAKLNAAQRQAVDYIDGPLLVVAGPGTGKTQLLATRIANILQKTDTLPQSILCLTFTESAAQNMRERLVSLISSAGFDVKISTYHGFGSEIIRAYPEYFENTATEAGDDSRLERPIDELTKNQLLLQIVERLPYDNPLKNSRYHLGDLIHTISDLKKSLLTPQKLRKLAASNSTAIQALSPRINRILEGVRTMPSKITVSEPLFVSILEALQSQKGSLAEQAASSLQTALESARAQQKTTPLTAWKNDWLYKTANNEWSFTDPKLSLKLLALANILEAYAAALAAHGLYDFDDMILRSIEAVKTNDELRFNLQERYLYLLLDEFQDTNAAQFELVKLLADNPVNEGRPNIMAVGDDDQAIFAFQGAEASNMIDFMRAFNDVGLINLTENYRSHASILQAASGVAAQIQTRLHKQLGEAEKTLTAVQLVAEDGVTLERVELADAACEYTWVAERIQSLIQNGTSPSEIAVLAPQHKYLEGLVPFLNGLNIPVAYEKRENILDAYVIKQLVEASRLVAALANGEDTHAARQLVVVLSHPAWGVPVEDVWQVNWQAAHEHKNGSPAAWLNTALGSPTIAPWVKFFMTLAGLYTGITLEQMLDYLTGSEPLDVGGASMLSPLKEYYFSEKNGQLNQLAFFETLTQLSVIRHKLREYQAGQEHQLRLADFLHFVAMYETAEQPLLNTHPIVQSDNAVQLMTAFKSKGLEFEQVFLLSLHDDVWGDAARGRVNKLTLPPNLKHIRYGGSDQDERLRLLFVAMTRAKCGLYLSSYALQLNGKKTPPLRYLLEEGEKQERTSTLLPAQFAAIQVVPNLLPPEHTKATELLWHAPHTQLNPTLSAMLKERLKQYTLSPTHVTGFIDLEYGGPTEFLLGVLLRFPRAPGEGMQFGNAVHETLDWYCRTNPRPQTKAIHKYVTERLHFYFKDSPDLANLQARAERALNAFLTQKAATFGEEDKSEFSFASEGVRLGEARLTGKIDRMVINRQSRTITVIDYKTGTGYSKWTKNSKLLKYRLQLCLYKLLVEHSQSFKGYRVEKGILEFVEPDEDGRCHSLELNFTEEEMKRTEALVSSIWRCIAELDLPDTSSYAASYAGSLAFVDALVGSDQHTLKL